jgi:hypothetical protein
MIDLSEGGSMPDDIHEVNAIRYGHHSRLEGWVARLDADPKYDGVP